jgi:alanine racemase
MIEYPSAPLALHLDSAALQSNWKWMARMSGQARCGAAIKANAYGTGAVDAMRYLQAAGCADYFVATWAEAAELFPTLNGASLSVLHGAREEDMGVAMTGLARPVLCSAEQISRWKAAGGGACDVMIDTGMNRLGLAWNDIDQELLRGLEVDTICSHLACADEDHPLNEVQLGRFGSVVRETSARRYSLANSAGILLGSDYLFDLTRPGLALYGGVARPEASAAVAQVVRPRAQVLQRRAVRAGESVGYGATFVAEAPREAAVLNLGYADGYLRGFSGRGGAFWEGQRLPLLGRVSMDLVVVDVTDAQSVREGSWLEIEYDLPTAAANSGLSQYELLTGLGRRFSREWI